VAAHNTDEIVLGTITRLNSLRRLFNSLTNDEVAMIAKKVVVVASEREQSNLIEAANKAEKLERISMITAQLKSQGLELSDLV